MVRWVWFDCSALIGCTLGWFGWVGVLVSGLGFGFGIMSLVFAVR